jgi:hypothetical protein
LRRLLEKLFGPHVGSLAETFAVAFAVTVVEQKMEIFVVGVAVVMVLWKKACDYVHSAVIIAWISAVVLVAEFAVTSVVVIAGAQKLQNSHSGQQGLQRPAEMRICSAGKIRL